MSALRICYLEQDPWCRIISSLALRWQMGCLELLCQFPAILGALHRLAASALHLRFRAIVSASAFLLLLGFPATFNVDHTDCCFCWIIYIFILKFGCPEGFFLRFKMAIAFALPLAPWPPSLSGIVYLKPDLTKQADLVPGEYSLGLNHLCRPLPLLRQRDAQRCQHALNKQFDKA